METPVFFAATVINLPMTKRRKSVPIAEYKADMAHAEENADFWMQLWNEEKALRESEIGEIASMRAEYEKLRAFVPSVRMIRHPHTVSYAPLVPVLRHLGTFALGAAAAAAIAAPFYALGVHYGGNAVALGSLYLTGALCLFGLGKLIKMAWEDFGP